MAARAVIDYFVLDALANDVESLDGVLALLNHADVGWAAEYGRHFTPQDVVPVLLREVRQDLLRVCLWSDFEGALVPAAEGVIPEEPVDRCWFMLTPRGRLLLESWSPEDRPR